MYSCQLGSTGVPLFFIKSKACRTVFLSNWVVWIWKECNLSPTAVFAVNGGGKLLCQKLLTASFPSCLFWLVSSPLDMYYDPSWHGWNLHNLNQVLKSAAKLCISSTINTQKLILHFCCFRADWAVRAVLKMSAIRLKYSFFWWVFFMTKTI